MPIFMFDMTRFHRWASTMTLQIPLISVLMLALGATTLFALNHETPMPRPGYAVVSTVSQSRVTPYGSGAALRNLLF